MRERICFLILLLTPFVVYWSAVTEDYGFRDDYIHLASANEANGKVVDYASSHGRPLYGALLETSFSAISHVEQFMYLRILGVALISLFAILLWRELDNAGWQTIDAAAVALVASLLPATQVVAAWASAWPFVVSLVLALAGFLAIESELEKGGLRRSIGLVGGAGIYLLAALTYQSNALYAIVPIAAVWFVKSKREPKENLRWLATHLGILFGALIISFFFVKMLFGMGLFKESARMAFETSPHTKLPWFLWQPVANALALYQLRDNNWLGWWAFWPVVAAVTAVIFLGAKANIAKEGPAAKHRWIVCAALFPFVAHGVSLLAAERATGYRTIFALSGLVVVLLVAAWRSLLAAEKIKPFIHYAGLALLVLPGLVLAFSQPHSLIADPQGREWSIMQLGVLRVDFKAPKKIHIVTPAEADRSTDRVFSDEFGSFSSARLEAARAMFKAALTERFDPKTLAKLKYELTIGPELPTDDRRPDVVIDMRTLRRERGQ
jgi:hypothetical protein